MISAKELFGANAGKVWDALSRNGSMNAGKLTEVTELEEHEVRAALGWLGREGKLRIEKEHNHYLYALA
jgi:DNA-binding transcriptional regulator PaaX